MEQLRHNGVLVQPRYEGTSLTIKVRGETVKLTPEQEEMAFAWAKKVGTTYVEDPVFAENVHYDFSKKLSINVKPGDVNYSDVLLHLEGMRTRKANLTKEERKRLTALRKVKREANKNRYGYAWVDGVQMEIANYAVEPSSIFIGRGNHPLRGRWKEGPREEDVELNLSPEALSPPGNWKGVVWEPNAMWIARWRDKLTGKLKYVWLSDSSAVKQRKDVEKFDRARELRSKLTRIQGHIWKNLDAVDLRRRKTATVCFLIDTLKIRVGDEKDPDEADTVGASTLRPEHIRFKGDSTVAFDFLGKDSVPHIFRVKLPEKVIRNLKEFESDARSTLFDDVSSKHVSGFLDEVMIGLSAKVFRTYYASEAVETKLGRTLIAPKDPEHSKKYVATMANLEAAKVCNHQRAIPKTWKSSLEKRKIRLKALRHRSKEVQHKLRETMKDSEVKYGERTKKHEEKLKAIKEKLDDYNRQLTDKKQQGKPIQTLTKRINSKRNTLTRQNQRIKNLRVKRKERMKMLRLRLESRRKRDKEAMDNLKLRIKIQEETRNYNLTSSLKSYIDPQIYYEWGEKVDYDWKLYYPKALQKKFSWIEIDKPREKCWNTAEQLED